jgi:hypothetical protein
MRNSAIGCACLLAVFEGVGIAMQRMFAQGPVVLPISLILDFDTVATRISTRCCTGVGIFIRVLSHLICLSPVVGVCRVESILGVLYSIGNAGRVMNFGATIKEFTDVYFMIMMSFIWLL